MNVITSGIYRYQDKNDTDTLIESAEKLGVTYTPKEKELLYAIPESFKNYPVSHLPT